MFKKATLFIVIGAVFLLSGTASAVTFPVTTNADAVGPIPPIPPGSLREAINMANSTLGKDTIIFVMPAPAVPPVVISPVAELPALMDPAGCFIDGFSQAPGGSGTDPSNLKLTVQLDGGSATPPVLMRGLHINSSYNEIKGLIITNFLKCGINIHGGSADHQANWNWIHFNIIGLQADGSTPAGNGTSGWHAGVSIEAGGHSSDGLDPNTGVAQNNTIEFNLISENTKDGVSINGPIAPGIVSLNTVYGNYIGTDQTGMLGRGNYGEGVCICEGAHDNLVRKNLISDNYFEGVGIQGYGTDLIYTYSNRIDSNVIGLDAFANPLGNGGHGVGIGCYDDVNGLWGFAADNTIGPDNVIAENGGDGVYVWEDQMNTTNGDGNQITQNSIYDNGGLGIDLQVDGVTANDIGDPDNAANQEMNFPIITSAVGAVGGTVVSGTCEPSTAIVEVFEVDIDPSGYGEGAIYLGNAVLDGFGGWTFTDVGMTLIAGDVVTATSTDGGPNTSEFCRFLAVSPGTSDDWDCHESPPPGKEGGGYEQESNNDCSNANDAACEMAFCGSIADVALPDEDWWMLMIPDDGLGTCNCLHIRVFGDATPGTIAYGGGLDPEVTVYVGNCPSALTQVMYNDDYYGTAGSGSAEGTDAQIDCDDQGNCFLPGTVIYIKITAQNQSQGDYLFVINCEPCECPEEPGSCDYYKSPFEDYAPSGMPDFDQKRPGWTIPGGSPTSYTWCGPVALANCLWWFDSKYEPFPLDPKPFYPSVDQTPPNDGYPLVSSYHPTGAWDDHDSNNVAPLVVDLAALAQTNVGKTGTDINDLATAASSYIGAAGLSSAYTVNLYPIGYDPSGHPTSWDFIREEVMRSQDVILLLGFYQENEGSEYCERRGGHFVTIAGTCTDVADSCVCISDPFYDNQESTTHSPYMHDDAQYISGPHGGMDHDWYDVAPAACIAQNNNFMFTAELPNYPTSLNPADVDAYFQGQNNWNQTGPVDPNGQPIHTIIEWALVICPAADPDQDGDGIPDDEDNCPTIPNPDQADSDQDGIGDVCDNCPGVPNVDQANSDGDSHGDACDNCPNDDNEDQANNDGDAWGNVCDNCPDHFQQDQADLDNDGIGDVCDPCTDTDGDGYGNPGYANPSCSDDNCPDDPNPDQANNDGDAQGDVCDPDDDNDEILDDGDGSGTIGDNPCTGGNAQACDDNCQFDPNTDQADADSDGVGDECEGGCCIGIRGNANGDTAEDINISDVTYLVSYLFGVPVLGPPPPCQEEGNANGDELEQVNISDVTYLVSYLFGVPVLGPPPPACP